MARGPWVAVALAALVGGVIYMVTKAGGGITAGIQAMAQAISVAEGFGTEGAIPTVRHNPGDLILGTDTTPTFFPDDNAGWQALYHQLALIASGASRYYRPDMTIQEMANTWTATEPAGWALNVARTLGVSVDTPISQFLS